MIEAIRRVIPKLKFPALFMVGILSLYWIYILIRQLYDPLLYFPIPGFSDEYGEFLPLHFLVRCILTIIVYGFVLVFLVTPLFYFQGCFKNNVFFKRYRIFWWVGGVIFSSILSILFGVFMLTTDIPYLIYTMVSFWSLTLTPAYYQHSQANSPTTGC